MNGNVDEWIYVGVVIVGAITLLVEANRNFSRVGLNDPFAVFPILRDARVSDLCSGREWIAGYLLYSLLYLLAYAILLSWAELLELVTRAEFARGQVGATGGVLNPVSDPFNLSELGYGKPIFISAFLISLFSINAMRPVEETLRGLAQRLAGIPHGIFRVIHDLSGIRWRSFLKEAEEARKRREARRKRRKGRLPSRLKAQPRQIKCDVPTPLLSDFELVQAGWEPDIRTRIDDRIDVEQAKDALYAVDFLAPGISGAVSQLYFPAQKLAKVDTLVQTFEEERETLRARIKALRQPGDFDSLDDFENTVADFQQRALLLKNSASALFAVHYIRNNRSIKETQSDDPYGVLQDHIQREYNAEHNSFAMSVVLAMMLGFVISLGAFILCDWVIPSDQNAGGVDPMIKQVVAVDAGGDFEGAQQAWRGICAGFWQGRPAEVPFECKTAWGDDGSAVELNGNGSALLIATGEPGAGTNAFTLLPPRPETIRACATLRHAPDLAASCAQYVQRAKREMIESRLGIYGKTAFWTVLKWGVAVFFSVSAALLMWEMRKDANSWKPWQPRRFPFIRFFAISLLPSLLLFVGLGVVDFARLWIDSSLTVSKAEILYFVRQNGPYLMTITLGGFVLSFAALVMMDQHDNWDASRTMGFAALAAVVYFCLAAFIIRMTFGQGGYYHIDGAWFDRYWRESVTESVVVMSFLLLFGAFLEGSETIEEQEEEENSGTLGAKFQKAREALSRLKPGARPESAQAVEPGE